jgi:hypothetical protein
MGSDVTAELVRDILRTESPRDHNPNLVRDLRLSLGCKNVLDVAMYLIYTARIYSEYNLHLLPNEHIEVIASMLVDPTPFFNELERQDRQLDYIDTDYNDNNDTKNWIIIPDK